MLLCFETLIYVICEKQYFTAVDSQQKTVVKYYLTIIN
jgi:hypothetical protein